MLLHNVGTQIWTYEGSTVSFYGFPFPTRMTVIRLANNALWIHSPEKLTDDLISELAALGEVKYLISPNKLHHLFLPEWIEKFPHARNYAAPGLAKKRKDISFDAALREQPDTEWSTEIDRTIFCGSPAMEEVVFYHKPSSTLILTDLIENFNPSSLNWFQKALANWAGILYPNGKMPIDWRASFAFGSKHKARQSLQTLISWQPENIILAHGECVYGNATNFLKKSFAWLSNNKS
jgi:hypothetical protein